MTPLSLAEAQSRFAREAVRGTCDTGRYRLSYYVWGQGAPLLFLHGVADSGCSFVPLIARLSAYFRCIAYDLPSGHGDGACLRRYTHADLVADLWALLDHLQVEQSYVMASSFGATIALQAMHERPRRLPRALLQGAFARRRLTRLERFLAGQCRFLPGPLRWLPLRQHILRTIHQTAFAAQPPENWHYFLTCSGNARLAAFARQVLLLDQIDLRPLLPEIRQPVLLFCGDQDGVVPSSASEELLHGLPNAGRVLVEGCGHVPSHTHPEVLANIIRQFLTPPAKERMKDEG